MAGWSALPVRRAAALIGVMALLAACGGAASTPAASGASKTAATTSAPAAKSGTSATSANTLVMSLISTGESKIPAYTTTGEDTTIMNQIYGSLLQVDPTDFSIKPSLATSYTVSPDGKTWTFHLRHGVKWQHGYGDFTCSDVQFTWNFNKNPANHSFWKTEADTVSSVDCPDPYTAVFHLAVPFQGFVWSLVNLEPSTGWIMSKAAWNKLGKAGYEKTPIGTGPYELQSMVPNNKVVLVRNPDYWGPKPAVGTIVFKVIADSQTAALAVETGSVDISAVDPVTAKQYVNAKNLQVVVKTSTKTDLLQINTKLPPFNNVLVRQAMRYAINYPGLVKTVYNGYAVPGYQGLVEKGQIGYDASVNPPNVYDPAKAKALLKESGVKLPIKGFFTTYNDTSDVNAGQFIAPYLAAVGIDLTSKPLERGTLVQLRIKPTTPANNVGWVFTPDPDFLFSENLISASDPPAGLNISRYSGIDQLYKEQHDTPSKSQRLKLLSQMQAKLAHDVPAIELQVNKDIWLVNDRVQGYEPQVLFGGPPLWLVTLK